MSQSLHTPDHDQLDGTRADLARNAQQALALLGWAGPAPLLPATCGWTDAERAAACLAAIRAVVTHHLLHLGAPPSWARAITKHTARKLAEECRHAQAQA